jgi:hypothetical protein
MGHTDKTSRGSRGFSSPMYAAPATRCLHPSMTHAQCHKRHSHLFSIASSPTSPSVGLWPPSHSYTRPPLRTEPAPRPTSHPDPPYPCPSSATAPPCPSQKAPEASPPACRPCPTPARSIQARKDAWHSSVDPRLAPAHTMRAPPLTSSQNVRHSINTGSHHRHLSPKASASGPRTALQRCSSARSNSSGASTFASAHEVGIGKSRVASIAVGALVGLRTIRDPPITTAGTHGSSC